MGCFGQGWCNAYSRFKICSPAQARFSREGLP